MTAESAIKGLSLGNKRRNRGQVSDEKREKLDEVASGADAISDREFKRVQKLKNETQKVNAFISKYHHARIKDVIAAKVEEFKRENGVSIKLTAQDLITGMLEKAIEDEYTRLTGNDWD